tara:strand:+ start:2821 stop:3642 length:822 start_codon:yes stop_codon:yes gene_type:complete
MTIKQIIKTVGLSIIGLILLITLFSAWVDVEPGQEGFAYRPYSGGVDIESSYTEGTYFIAPWNNVITYNILQQSKSYNSTVMDVNGTDISVEVAVNFSVKKGSASKLHLKHGTGYIQFIDDKVKGAIKDVVGRYTYQEVYSTKREALEGEMEEILVEDFTGNHIVFHYVEIADVNLPKNIATEITNKETQKQKNLTAEQKQQEQIYLASAKIETAKGDSAKVVIKANAEAQSIKIKQKQLRQSPQYIEYLKAVQWDGKMPQVVGSGGLIIDLK